MSGSTSLLEKERNRDYLVLVSREIGLPGEFVEGQGKSSLRAKDSRLFRVPGAHYEGFCEEVGRF